MQASGYDLASALYELTAMINCTRPAQDQELAVLNGLSVLQKWERA